MYIFFRDLDRRWIFLVMFLAVAIPILLELQFPEAPSPIVQNVFDAIENLPDGSVILLAFDYDPASKGELEPMAAAFTRHCAEKKHKLIFMTLWPQGVPMLQNAIDIVNQEYPQYTYGTDYVNLGFRPGSEGVIKVVVGDMKELFTGDQHGTSLTDLPLTQNLKNIREVDLLANVSAGSPGTKEWVQYAATPYQIPIVTGTTGVTAPGLYPYIPDQMIGMLGAIKGAAEYEKIILQEYPRLAENPKAEEGLRRMGPQLTAHVLMVVLIVIGNIVYFVGRRRGDVR